MVTVEHTDDNPLDFGISYGSETQIISSFVILNVLLSRAVILLTSLYVRIIKSTGLQTFKKCAYESPGDLVKMHILSQ